MSPRQAQTPSLGQRSQNPGVRALVICTLLSVALLVLGGNDNPIVNGFRGAVQFVTTPVRELGSIVSSPFVGLSNVVTNLTTDQQTLSELRAENERLRSRNVELEEAALDTQRLQELLDLKSSYNLQSLAARIISGSADSWSRSVTIDKGESSGLTVNMPVACVAGVVGQIVDLGPTSSTVRLLTDENSSVAAMVQSSRAHGMLRGSVSGELYLDLVAADLDVAVGDVVITSGLGGVFPKGLPLGIVTGVETADGALYHTITVEPFARTNSLEEVLVITSLTEEQTATAEDIAEADAQENGTYDTGEDEDGEGEGESASQPSDGSQTTEGTLLADGMDASADAVNTEGGIG